MPEIRIIGNFDRFEIVKRVVWKFIEYEKNLPNRNPQDGIIYLVERFSDEDLTPLRIKRPGYKKNFDFEVLIIPEYGLGEGSHEELVNVFLWLSETNPNLIEALREVYCCERDNDVDSIIRNYSLGIREEIFLKVVKWLFIMEDIIYWHYKGREFLFNLMFYNLNLHLRGGQVPEYFERPQSLEKAMKRIDLTWQTC
jgi:hypothetical protein